MIGPFALIIPAGVLQNSSDVFNILDPDSGGSKSFTVKLSANGAEPASHYGANTWLEEGTVDALKNMTTTQFKAYVDQLATQRGRAPVGSITAFKGSLLMGEQGGNFWDFVTANGLKRVVISG